MAKSFQLVSKYKPAGDQPKAIESLLDNLDAGLAHQVCLLYTSPSPRDA